MLKTIGRAVLKVLRSARVFERVANSSWRRNRLLILCYHGVARGDEHLWRPHLYMHPSLFRQRLELLKRGNYNVLPLATALARLRQQDLPERSVAITFDDGAFDFYDQAYPLVKSYGFPVTVYQTTYYSEYSKPVFNLICSYMLWKRRGSVLPDGKPIGLPGSLDLKTEARRTEIVRSLLRTSEAGGMTGAQRNDLAARLAELLHLDYDQILANRTLQLMNRDEIALLAAEGVDFQLHTHRHSTPIDEKLFRKEIQDNRRYLPQSGRNAVHFCYPSGVYRDDFLPWLRAEGVISATTCNPGLASGDADPFLLPRLVDTSEISAVEFESWLTGIRPLLRSPKPAPRIVPIAAGRGSQVMID